MSEVYIVSETIKYSDGSEKVVLFNQNPNAEAIETLVAKEMEEHRGERPAEDVEIQSESLPVTGTEEMAVVDESTVSETE